MGGWVGSLPTEKQKCIFKSRGFNQSGLQAKNFSWIAKKFSTYVLRNAVLPREAKTYKEL